MTTHNDLHILIIDESIVELTMLMTLLSPITKNLVTCTTYTQGFEILSNLKDSNSTPDLIFLALPPSHHHECDLAIKLFALALQNANPAKTIILGGDKLPPEFDKAKIKDNFIMYKPITRQKLQEVLKPLNLNFSKINCWEYMDCGREPGGRHTDEKGICPAGISEAADGIHSGKHGGRVCWAISGTMCGGSVQGTFAGKISNCQDCDFYQLVQLEEGPVFESVNSVLNRLKRKHK